MQTSRKKGKEFIREFSKIIKPAVIHVYREGDSPQSVLRVLDVWKQRHVLPQDFIDDIIKAIKGEGPLNQLSEETSIPAPLLASHSQANDPIVSALQTIQESEITRELLEERTSLIFQALIDPNKQEELSRENKLDDFIQVIEKYKIHLNEDLEKRTNLISLLTEYISKQETAIDSISKKIQHCENGLEQAKQLKENLSQKRPLEEMPPSVEDSDVPPSKMLRKEQVQTNSVEQPQPPSQPLTNYNPSYAYPINMLPNLGSYFPPNQSYPQWNYHQQEPHSK